MGYTNDFFNGFIKWGVLLPDLRFFGYTGMEKSTGRDVDLYFLGGEGKFGYSKQSSAPSSSAPILIHVGKIESQGTLVMDFVSYRYNADQTNYKTGTIFIRNNYSKITARMNHVEGDGDLHFYYLKASDNTVDLYVASGTSASYKSIAVFVKIGSGVEIDLSPSSADVSGMTEIQTT